MKKIGIIGGLGPESTAEYYSGIIKAFSNDYEKDGFPELAIESLNLKTFLQLATENKWDIIAGKIALSANKLKNSGAEFGAIASNTPHYAWESIVQQTELPLISIVEETSKFIQSINLGKVLLLGTKFTMSTTFYPSMLEDYGINTIIPNPKQQEFIHEKIFSELEFGIVKDETKIAFQEIIETLNKDNNFDGVVMACTELPLLLKPEDVKQVYIDPTQIHIDAIVKSSRKA